MDFKAKKVLIADDEPDIVEILRYNLEKEGYHVITAKDGDEAINKAKQSNPDLVILDMMMPKKTVWKFARYLEHNRSLRTL